MNTQTNLPEDVIAAIRANRKIEAIKLLRRHHGLDLKDAKDAVDMYAAQHRPGVANPPLKTESGLGRIVVIGLVIALAYAGYRFLF